MNAIEKMAGDALKPHQGNTFFNGLIIEFGGMVKAAHALGVTHQCVHNWKTRGVPLSRVKQIEELSEGRVHRGML